MPKRNTSSSSTERAGVIVTQMIKIAGVAVVMVDLARNDLQAAHIALASFMMAGATSLESLLPAILEAIRGDKR